MKTLNDILREMLTWGTPACGLFCGICGIVLAVLLLTLGFWKTLFVAILCVIGVFVGGVKDKAECLKKIVNKIFPPQSNS